MTSAEACRVLEVAPDAAWPLIRESYLDLVRVWHPDRFEADPRLRAKAEARLVAINAAYRALDRRHNDPSLPPPGPERRHPPVVVQQPAATARRTPRSAVAAALLVAVTIALVITAWMLARPVSAPKGVAVPPAAVVDDLSKRAVAPASIPAVSASARPSSRGDSQAAPSASRSFIARETDAILRTPVSPTATRQRAAGSR
jgi:hypothetical protein